MSRGTWIAGPTASSRVSSSRRRSTDLAHWSRVPVINALSDMYHPCQALADIVHFEREIHDASGAEAGLRRRRQQCRAFADAVLRAAGHPFRYRVSARLRARRQDRRAGAGLRGEHGLDDDGHERSLSRRSRRPTRSTPMSGPAWGRNPRPTSDGASSSRSGERSADGRAGPSIWRSCIAFRRSADRKSPTRSRNAPNSVIFDQAENRLHAQKALLLMMLD